MSSEFDGANPKDVTLGGKFYPRQVYPDVTVKLGTIGRQLLTLDSPVPKTYMETQMWKIPIRDETVSKAGGGNQHYRGVKEGALIGSNTVNEIINERIAVKPEQSVVEAKRRKPVDIPKEITIKEKNVAINLANPNEVRLDDLTFENQKRVLGTSDLLSEKPPKIYSAVDVPPGGYDIKKPRYLAMTEGQKIDLLERNAGNYANYVNSVKPGENPFILRQTAQRRTDNSVRLVQRINFNNRFQEQLFNTSF